MDRIKKYLILAMACILVSLVISTVVSAQDEYEYDWNSVNDAAWTFWGLSGIICFVVFLIPLIIGILIAIWVYRDAEKRGSSGVLWLIIVLLTSIIGLIIWLVVRPPIGGHPQQGQQQGRMCTNCGRPIPMDAQVCPYCGKDFRH